MPPLRIRTPLRPTEDPERVQDAILNLFPDARITVGSHEVEAEAGDVSRLRELVRAQRIPDTARGIMLAGLSADGSRARFLIGKQAAAAGRAHFGALGSPLGELEVEMAADAEYGVLRLIYHVAPDTTVEADLAEIPPPLRPGGG